MPNSRTPVRRSRTVNTHRRPRRSGHREVAWSTLVVVVCGALLALLPGSTSAFGQGLAGVAPSHSIRQLGGDASFAANLASAHQMANVWHVNTAEAKRRLSVQAKAWNIVQQTQGVLGAHYAGVWFDAATGRFKIGLQHGAASSAIRSTLSSAGIAADTDFVPVSRSWDDLVETQATVDKDLRTPLARGQVQTAIDTENNTVVISVPAALDTADTALVDAATAATSGAAVVRTAPAAQFTVRPDSCTYPGCTPYYEAGQGVYAISTTNALTKCTGGFEAYDPRGYRYILTAGHCLQDTPGQQWYAYDSGSGKLYGLGAPSLEQSYENTSGDAGLFAVSGTRGDFGFSGSTALYVLWGYASEIPLAGVGASYEGLAVAHSGVSSGTQAGYVTAVHQTVAYTTGQIVGSLTAANFCSITGDSGGPVVNGLAGYGIDVGGSCSAQQGTSSSYYTELSTVLSHFYFTFHDIYN